MKAITNSFMGLNEIYFHAAAVKVGLPGHTIFI
jgi:hypothetical protein